MDRASNMIKDSRQVSRYQVDKDEYKGPLENQVRKLK